jgi:hypothetical protein
MVININAGHHIHGGESLEQHFKQMVLDSVEHYGEMVTRVNVNIKDVNADKHGSDDKHCAIEARLSGLKPTAVTCESDSVEAAVSGALDKLVSHLDSLLGKLNDR